MMAASKCLIAVLVFAPFLAIATAQASDRSSPKFEELMQASNAASDLSAAGPYEMQGDIEIHPDRERVVQGLFGIARDGDQSRAFARFKDYAELSVATGNKLYILRKPSEVPAISHFLRGLDRSWHATEFSPPGQSVPYELSESRGKLLCYKRSFTEYVHESICFDPAKKVLISREIKGASYPTRFLFSDYQAFAGQQFPTRIQYFESGALEFEAHISKVVKARFAQDFFNSPPGAPSVPTCLDLQPAILVKHVDPSYSGLMKMAHLQGEVRIAATIDSEGKLTNMKVVRGHPFMAQAALEALKDWRYIPALCASGPVESDTEIEVWFHM